MDKTKRLKCIMAPKSNIFNKSCDMIYYNSEMSHFIEFHLKYVVIITKSL